MTPRSSAVARRRRRALLVVTALATAAGAAIGSGADDESPPVGAVTPACPSEIAGDPGRLAGQMLVVRMEDTATPELRRAARRGELGGVVLFPSPGAKPRALAQEVEALRAAASGAGMPEPLVAIDQEGGEVKRLPSLPPHESPSQIGADAQTAQAEGQATGRALARLGIDVDLAPVLDVPASGESFISSRALATDPSQVSAAGAAFASGLASAGVAATAKHFPGLGNARVNTDESPSAIGASRAELTRGLAAFDPSIQAPLSLVMVANATYPAYDERRPASLSPRIVGGLLRGELGFDGVVITDDLGAGALVQSGVDEGEAAVAAVRAGADLLLFALSDGSDARTALVRGLHSGRLQRAPLVDACSRVQALRARLGAQPES